MRTSAKLKTCLIKMPEWFIAIYAAICSFAVYFCMYAFRKPFTVAGFEGMVYWHIDYKVWLVTAQVVGYMLSKFYGIRFISSLNKTTRAGMIIKLILCSWAALLLFALIPSPYSIIFLLLNGFPLGMVWGLVFSYLEGRRATEFMGAVLCTSFIFSSGVVKTIGKSILLYWHVTEAWMPFVTGSLFVLPLFLFTWLLNHLPEPTKNDELMRCKRKAMNKEERRSFIKSFFPGILLIVTTYVLLTILRDFRDNFANELFAEMGFSNDASIFSISESYVSLFVLLCISLLVLVKNNFTAFLLNHYIIISGYLIALISTLFYMRQDISPFTWMILAGTGLYLSYVPFNALYFERMIACYRINANVGFIMYISDAFGYLGSVLVLFLKEFIGIQLSWTNFFITMVIIISIAGMLGTLIASIYFQKKYSNRRTNELSYTK